MFKNYDIGLSDQKMFVITYGCFRLCLATCT